MKPGFLNKLIARIGKVGPEEMQTYLLRLVQEKGFLERVFDALQEGVIVTDDTGVVNYLNRAAANIFGLDAATAIDRPMESQINGLSWDELVSPGESITRDLEIFYPENRFLNFYLSPLDDEGGDVFGYVMLVRDITTDRKVVEEQLESERVSALTMLAAGVAHEIGNPLNSLNIHLQLVERKLRDIADEEEREPVEKLLGVARDEINRLDQIVSQFLEAIRPSMPKRVVTDVNTLVEEAARFLEQEIRDRNVVLTLSLNSNIPTLNLDPGQMKQAFYNVMKNGMEAMAGEGELTISTDMSEDEVLVSFADTGSGITSEEMSRIFDPYFTTKKSGSGLGLLIVRRIVREHGGEIELTSRGNGGTRLTIHLRRYEKNLRFLEPPQESTAEVIEV